MSPSPSGGRGRRAEATVLHVDLDAFFAAVEQRDKPSLRGRPVIVGGTGGRGVVATASYEARVYGVHSAMSTAQARARCPHAAYLGGRFGSYREASRVVMAHLRTLSPLVEPLSLDEAFVDLAASERPPRTPEEAGDVARQLRADLSRLTDGLTASVGVATSKLMAKIASELDKPDGQHVVPPGTEEELLAPMAVSVIPGVGPATTERLRRIGVVSVADLVATDLEELTRAVGVSAGASLHRLGRGLDDRPVVAERGAKSVSVEDTFGTDLTDPARLAEIAGAMAVKVAGRLARSRASGRTITLKVRHHDFSTHTRSSTLSGPTDDPRVLRRVALGLLAEVDVSDGIRLLGVGVSGLADWVQDDLFGEEDDDTPRADVDDAGDPPGDTSPGSPAAPATAPPAWRPGQDVVHAAHGPGWVWGSGRGRVTVRFETRTSPPGPVRTFATDDPDLQPAPEPPDPDEEPLTRDAGTDDSR